MGKLLTANFRTFCKSISVIPQWFHLRNLSFLSLEANLFFSSLCPSPHLLIITYTPQFSSAFVIYLYCQSLSVFIGANLQVPWPFFNVYLKTSRSIISHALLDNLIGRCPSKIFIFFFSPSPFLRKLLLLFVDFYSTLSLVFHQRYLERGQQYRHQNGTWMFTLSRLQPIGKS